MGSMVHLVRERRICDGSDEFHHARNRLLWEGDTVDHHRCHSVLQQVEVATEKSAHVSRTVGVHEARAHLPFHDGDAYGLSAIFVCLEAN